MNENEGTSVSGGDGPAATTTSTETKVEVDRTTGDAVAEDSRQGEGNEAPAGDAPKKLKFTGKVRRGLALFRMVQIAALKDDMPPAQTMISRWTKAQQSDYSAALAWCEQEEDWEAVEDAWDRGRNGR